MSKAKWREQLLLELSDRCAQHDFSRSANPPGVKRVDNGRRFVFNLIFLDRRQYWDIRCWWGVRVEAVEAIYHRNSGFDKKYHKGTTTVGIEYESYFPLWSEEEVQTVVEDLYQVFVMDALPFFRHATSIQAIEKLLNENPNELCQYQDEPQRYHYGLILARAVGRKTFDRLAKTYRKKSGRTRRRILPATVLRTSA